MPMSHADADNAATVRQLELDDLPRTLRWLVLLQNGLAPYVWYILVTANSSSSNTYLLVAWIGLWFCTAVAAGLARRLSRPNIALVLAFALSVVTSLVWVGYADAAYVVWMLPALVATTLYRVRRFLADSFLNDENRLAFHLDCVLVVMGLFGCAALTGTVGPVFAFACANGLGAIVIRMYTLWRVERISHDSDGGPKGAWVWIATGFIFLALFGPVLGPYLIYGILMLIGLLMSPLAWLLPRNWHWQLPDMQNDQKNKSQYDMLKLQHQHASDWFGIVILVLLAGIVVFLLMQRFRRRVPKARAVQATVSTARRWIGRSETLRLLPTDNPVRLEFQKLIREQHMSGNNMKSYETAKAFLERTYGADTSPDAVNRQAGFSARYNQARYQSETPDQP